MGISLKDINRPMLAAVLLANVAIYMVVLQKGIAVEGWDETLSSLQNLIPSILVSIIAGVINAQIDHVGKARLVFWKWSEPLPGSRAFTQYAATDPRIDGDALKAHHNPLPTDPVEQNALWFKWYREFQNEASIKQVHREYLFTRDYTGISFLLILCLGPLAMWQMGSIEGAGIYIAILLAQYLLVRRAARNHGIRFVASVLAYKASTDSKAGGTRHGEVCRD